MRIANLPDYLLGAFLNGGGVIPPNNWSLFFSFLHLLPLFFLLRLHLLFLLLLLLPLLHLLFLLLLLLLLRFSERCPYHSE